MASISKGPFSQKKSGGTPKSLEPIQSSFLQQFKYDDKTFQLTVTMKTGAQYVYNSVDPATFNDLMEAPSKGKFYADYIKGRFGMANRVVDKNVGPRQKKL